MFINGLNNITSDCQNIGQLYANGSVVIGSPQANTRNVFVISKAPGNTTSDILLYNNTTYVPCTMGGGYNRTEIPGDGFIKVGGFPSGWGYNTTGYYAQEVMMFNVNHTTSQITTNISALMTKWGIV